MPLYNPPTAGAADSDATLTFTDITTNNSSTSQHGFLKKLDNAATNFMNGQGAWAVPAGTGTGATASQNFIGSDVAMTNSNTFYDGPSLSLAAGTYLLFASVNVDPAASGYVTAKIWDGTTGLSSAMHGENGGFYMQIALHAYVVLGGTTTIKVSCAGTSGGGRIMTTVNSNGVTNKASHLLAVKIA